MLSKPLLVTLLAVAPSGALAFGDLDCVGVEYCTATGCTPSFMVFSVEFDWPGSAVDLAVGSSDPLRLSLLSPDVSPDGTSGQLAYGQLETEQAAALQLTFMAQRIEAAITLGDNTTHSGLCAHREAA